MRILKDHYEKIILVASLVCATVISLISLLSVPESVVQDDGSELDMFWFDTNENGEQVLEFSKETRLSPGDTLTFVSKEDENSFKTFEIAKIALKSRDSYALEIDGKIIDGMLMSNNDLFLDRMWKKSKAVLDFVPDSGRPSQIPLSQVSSITGKKQFIFDDPIVEFDPDEYFLSLYQGMNFGHSDHNETRVDRVRWTTSAEESNESIYDLFTPPIIYLVDGNLTTKLPEKEVIAVVKTEEFGLTLETFQQKPYRFRMKGFTREFPFFEDLDPTNKEKRLNTRIKMVPGTTYKSNSDGKPGSPSLIPTTEDDLNKLLMVTVFRVDTVQDEKSGGVRPIGRAMVKDFNLGGKVFEIRHGWTEVFAGENEIILNYRLEGTEEKIVLSDKDIGKTVEFGSRKYLIKEIDLSGKSLLIEKRGPNPNDLSTEKLALP